MWRKIAIFSLLSSGSCISWKAALDNQHAADFKHSHVNYLSYVDYSYVKMELLMVVISGFLQV